MEGKNLVLRGSQLLTGHLGCLVLCLGGCTQAWGRGHLAPLCSPLLLGSNALFLAQY